jgi:hypothetical protein
MTTGFQVSMNYRSTDRAKQENTGSADFAALAATKKDRDQGRECAALAHGLC